jgi:NAD(P)-dependent dehydrogenase (short-subunit alcohol dehydrogenase family)
LDSTDEVERQIVLSGQVAIVTGGGRGLGRAIAQSLALAGVAVALVARSADQLAETAGRIVRAGGHALTYPADVTDQRAVEQMAARVAHDLGPVTLLVNNAGIIQALGPSWEVPAEDWWRTLEVNLRGPFLCTSAVLPAMIHRRQGRIINIASPASLQAIAYGSAYVVSKTALVRFSENLAQETAEHSIGVFAVDPGTVRTAMAEYLLESAEGQRWLPWFSGIFEEGHDVRAERVAQLAVTLASGQADVLSGRFLSVEDDLAALVEQAATIDRDDLYTLRLRRL